MIVILALSISALGLSAYGWGLGIVSLLRLQCRDRLEQACVSVALGCLVLSLSVFGISVCGWLRPPVLAGLVGAGILVMPLARRSILPSRISTHDMTWPVKLLVGVIAACMVANFVGALAPVSFNLEQAYTQSGFSGLNVVAHNLPRAFDVFEIFANVVDRGQHIAVDTQFNYDLFELETIRDWLTSYEALLSGAVQNPGCALSEPVRLDPFQVLPPRTLTIRATLDDSLTLEITVAGIFPPAGEREIICSVETVDAHYLGSGLNKPLPDLGWESIPLIDESGAEAMEAHLTASATHYTTRVGIPRGYLGRVTTRILVVEYEVYPLAHPELEGRKKGRRAVYADHAILPYGLHSTPLEQASPPATFHET